MRKRKRAAKRAGPKREKRARGQRDRQEKGAPPPPAKRLSEPVLYEDGAGFLVDEGAMWVAYALVRLTEGVQEIAEAGDKGYTNKGMVDVANRAMEHIAFVRRAITRKEWGHALYHMLRYGIYHGILDSSPDQYHLTRRLHEAEPDIAHGRKFKGRPGHGRPPTVTDEQLRDAFARLRENEKDLKPRTRAFYDRLGARVGLVPRQLRRRLVKLKLI